MKTFFWQNGVSRRGFLKGTLIGASISLLNPFIRVRRAAADSIGSKLYWVKNIPNQPFYSGGNGNYHAGVENLLHLMGNNGLKFYRSSQETSVSGPSGMIEPNDVVLIKVNAQWKYRGSTNSDLIRGLIQRILGHPDGFNGEVVIFENGQGQGSLNGDALGWGSYPDNTVHANANDESHSFLYLVNVVFNDPRVSGYLLDPIRSNMIGSSDHVGNGYRTYENVSYPCFTTHGGHRVELKEGIWQESGYSQNLKLINVPVLKIHGGSEITASLKHFYGVLSMADGVDSGRHYSQLGNTCGKMVVSVRTPVINILDAIWVSHASLSGYPANTTFRANQVLAGQDPVALDYWAAKYILYPKTNLPQHLPTYSGIDQWLTSARDVINGRGGLSNPGNGIQVGLVTKSEAEMSSFMYSAPSQVADFDGDRKTDILWQQTPSGVVAIWHMNGGAIGSVGVAGTVSGDWQIQKVADFNGDGKADILWQHTSGTVAIWFMNGATIASVGVIGNVSNGWQIKGVGDFDGDGKADILWQHTSGTVAIWFMDGATIASVGVAGTISSGWQIKGLGDFNGDGKTDILWQHSASGTVAIWIMNGTTVSSVGVPGPIPSDWQIKGIGDFDGDGKADILWQHPTSGTVAIWFMNGVTIASVAVPGVIGTDWQIKGIGDFDGNGKVDILWQHPASGRVALWIMNGAAISSIGVPGAIPSDWQIVNGS
jgi:hypothetical protein